MILCKRLIYDLCGFTFQQPRDHDPYHVLILRDGAGKSVKDKTQFVKTMHHKVPELYSIGALNFLFSRFDVI